MSNKIVTKKKKKKINSIKLWSMIVSVITILALIVLVVGLIFLASLLKDKPTLNVNDFDQTESSVIYDSQGREIANLGTVIRQNVEFDEIPNSVVDAFIAIEDSRFFQHNGFDIPRFTKAIIEDILAGSFEQGGSTFTMQLVKNTYFVNDDTGEEAARSGTRGVKRKAQEISLAMELEKYKTKQSIFESYVNKLNFGGSNNIRGIQKAAQYYFGKNISECNLVEGALLAGVINAPNYYNPFYNLEAAQERLTKVLYQMKNHGYIDDHEYQLAKSVRVEDLLRDPYIATHEGDGIPYQAYIDVVVSEVIALTGLDPYSTTMNIKTYMNRDIQNQMDKIQAGDMGEYLQYPDDYFEVASACIKNSTGEVVAILGGRNYAGGGQLLLNHASEQYKQPGSSIKPILDYALAFENLGWATDHVLTDKPMYMDNSYSNLVYNDSGTYVGDVTLRQALGESINTCAIQTLQQVLDAKKYEYVVNYTQSLGYDFNLEDFNVQYAMGGSTCEVTPLMHAGAYTAIMNYGVYNKPHTIERIEFTNGKSPIAPVYESVQVISEAAAYLTTELMRSNVENYGGTYDYVKSEDYTVYAKTGTTDFGSLASEYGFPSNAIKDGWLVAATSEYTTATWVGYERIVSGQQSYINRDFYYGERPQGKIAHLILEACYQYGNQKPSKLEKPSGVTSITHILGTWPYATFQEGMDESLRSTGLIKSDSAKLISLAEPKVAELDKNCEVEIDAETGALTINWTPYPDKNQLEQATNVKDISLRNSSGDVIIAASGNCIFDYTKLYGPIKYKADIKISGSTEEEKNIKVSEDHYGEILHFNPGDIIDIDLYYGYDSDIAEINSNKISFQEKAKTTVVIPTSGSLNEIQNWAQAYSFFAFKKEATDSKELIDTFIVTDALNNPITDRELTIEDNDELYIVTYYVEKEHTLSVVLSTSDNKRKITLLAKIDSDSKFIDWNYNERNNVSFHKNGNKLEIDISKLEDNLKFNVTAVTDYKRVNRDISITFNEDGTITVE